MTLKLAIIDLYDGTPNQGMRCIIDIVNTFDESLTWEWFDLRQQAAIPNIDDFDIFIFSGGPGDPREGDGIWDKKLYQLFDDLWAYNHSDYHPKKFAFFICHSFQMMANHFALGQLRPRRARSFGTFPIHKTEAGKQDPLLAPLPDPFTAADFRSYQVIQPNRQRLAEMGAAILAMEKERAHVNLERAIMAIRLCDEMVGVQFHPEADAAGMLAHFRTEEEMVQVINEFGKQKYATMIKDLSHPDKISLTQDLMLPRFITMAIEQLRKVAVPV